MQNRVALIGIIVENREESEKINKMLHDYSEYIIGRMGVPYRERGINVMSIVIDGPQEEISALSGKLGMLNGVTTKVIYSKNNME